MVGIWEVSPAQFSNRFESYELSNAKRPLNRAPNLFSFSPSRVRIEESNRCYFKYCSQFSTHRFPPFLTYQTERGTLVRKFSTHGDDSWKLLEDLVEQRSMFQLPNFESLIGTIGTLLVRVAMRKDERFARKTGDRSDSMDDRVKRPLDSLDMARITADARSELEPLSASAIRPQIYIDPVFENARLISAGMRLPKRRAAYSSPFPFVRRGRMAKVSQITDHLYGQIRMHLDPAVSLRSF